jgi:hypothetical protein
VEFSVGRGWRDLLSSKSPKLCLLTRLNGWGRANVEATRPRTAAHFVKDMLAICLFESKAVVTRCAEADSARLRALLQVGQPTVCTEDGQIEAFVVVTTNLIGQECEMEGMYESEAW